MTYYNSLNSYLRNRFQEKVYKLALSCSKSCPNRDGTCGDGGCIFCSQGGSGDFAAPYEMPISEQLEFAKKLVGKKAKNRKYIAYFQSFTSTYGDIDHIKHCFEGALCDPEVVAISVATRPDCLQEDIMKLLINTDKEKPVMVELGLQTIHESTAKFINRGTSLLDFDRAIKALKTAGLNVTLHIILGLPHETREMMLQTVKYVAESGADGIKLQLLHVLKNTKLEQLYNNGDFRCMKLEEYVAIAEDCVKLLPPQMVVHRITGDGDKKQLVAPLWSGNKRMVLQSLSKVLQPRN